MSSQFALQASTSCIPSNQEHISYRSPVTANFLLKFSNFRYHGNRGWSETNFTYTVKFADPETPYFVQESGTYLPYKPSYSKFPFKIFKFSLTWQPGSGCGKCKWHHWIRGHRKPPTWCKNQEHISHRSQVIANFLLKFSNFRCHGNRGRSETNFAYTVQFDVPKTPLVGAIIGDVSCVQAEL